MSPPQPLGPVGGSRQSGHGMGDEAEDLHLSIQEARRLLEKTSSWQGSTPRSWSHTGPDWSLLLRTCSRFPTRNLFLNSEYVALEGFAGRVSSYVASTGWTTQGTETRSHLLLVSDMIFLWQDTLPFGHLVIGHSLSVFITGGHTRAWLLSHLVSYNGSLSGPRALSVTFVLGHPWWVLSLFSQTHPLPIRAQEKSLPHLESGNNLSVKKLGD